MQGVPVIGANLAAPPDLAARYNETAQHAMADSCRRNYRQRIARIIKFWKEKAPDYYAVGVKKVSVTDLTDQTKYFFNGAFTEDLVYEG